ncbi:PAS domain S-box protein [Paenibacillus nanensis]|uniref:histidine kinase n=1 Tax=Paenibacillus nanensis TaxID=393251 RepID=A0A3A1V576_9BACL|nr:PAS domain S-box protein [Paenibacillus nanensis]RIX52700.1 PAS domain S-box protein [Paenibacillus nanensis]
MDATTEQLLQESRVRYETLVHCLPDGVIVHSNFQILFVNEAALKLVGATSSQQLEGRHLFDLIHQEYHYQLKERVEGFIERGVPSSPLLRKLIRLDGSIVSTEVRAIPITYDGKSAVQLIVRDLSPMLQMEETLNEWNDLYKTLVESVVAGVFVAQQNEIVYANPYLLDMLGYSLEELQGLPVDAVVDTSKLVLLHEDQCTKHMAGKTQYPFKVKGKRKDGRSIYLEGNCSSISFNGEEAILGTIQDVTLKQEQEQMLQNSAKLYQQMLMCIPEPIFITDEDEVLYANKHAIELAGQPDDSLMIGQPFLQFIHENDRKLVQEDIERAMTLDEPTAFREIRILLDDRILEAEVSYIRIDNYMGRSVVLSVVRDLTDRKRSEEQMLRSEKLSVIGQLAAGVAHEIRNPLTALKGFTQLLRSKYKDESSYFEIMAAELDRINLIVNEFMTLARPHLTSFEQGSFAEIIQSVLSILETQAILLNVEICCELEANLPMLYCNGNQLKQVFLNVVKNAIEAMPDGGKVHIQANMAETGKERLLHVRIHDEGPGIPNEVIRRLGEPFVTTKEKGTGLGLMVSTRIIEAHLGKLQIYNRQGKGTTVEITLPIKH